MKQASRLVLVSVTILGLSISWALAGSDPEARILNYIRDHLKAGQPVKITELYNNVFTKPDERQALNKLYNAFFRIPMFIVQYQQKFSTPPSLEIIAQQFALKSPEEADTLLRIMESDPRVPKFITRNPKTGEITGVDIAKILGDPRFGQGAAHRLAGWQGVSAPPFDLVQLDGSSHLTSAELRGKVILLYIWFTGCPPCMKETPALVNLQHEFGPKRFTVLGANADDMLGLSYSEQAHRRYLQEEKISFPVVRWTRETDDAYGGIAIYPSLFLINQKGIVTDHWVGYAAPAVLRQAVAKTVAKQPEKQ
ncbi:MAG: TlpA family protein disulfide reductase [Acidobacteria bacterium]|nr:TlpA family protein disulfide reductase [Acidobacteriota bacterium]